MECSRHPFPVWRQWGLRKNEGGSEHAEGDTSLLITCPWLLPLSLQDGAVVACQGPAKAVLLHSSSDKLTWHVVGKRDGL